MSFMAAEPPTANSTPPPDATVVKNDGWYVDIDLPLMRDAMRLDGTVTEPRLRQAVIAAMVAVNLALTTWKQEQTAAGIRSLEDVAAEQIDGKSVLISHYHRAVYSFAKADLIERYRDYDSTATSLNDYKTMAWLDNAPSDQRRNAHWAIADIVGKPHMTVELI